MRIVRGVPVAGLGVRASAPRKPTSTGWRRALADRVVCLGPGSRARQLPAAGHRRPGGARHRLRRDPSRLRLPVREPGARGAGPRARADVRRAAGERDRAGRRQARRPRPPRGAPASPCCPAARRRRRGAPASWPRRSATRVLVKAAGGGGGRGIKRVDDESELDALLALARSEAGRGVRRRPRLPGAAGRAGAPRRGADRRRRARAWSSTSASATARCSAATRR